MEEPHLCVGCPAPCLGQGPCSQTQRCWEPALQAGTRAGTQAETGGWDSWLGLGAPSRPAVPRLQGSLSIFLPGFQKKCMGGTPRNSSRTREGTQRRSRGGGRQAPRVPPGRDSRELLGEGRGRDGVQAVARLRLPQEGETGRRGRT